MSTDEIHTSFGRLNQIEAGLLKVAYAEVGPADGGVREFIAPIPR